MKTFTCPTCKKEWPQNYCLMCGCIIDKTAAPPTTLAPVPPDEPESAAHAPLRIPPRPAGLQTPPDDKAAAQKASVVNTCLWWFGVLIVLNILLFWTPLVLVGYSLAYETKFSDFVFDWGMPFVWVLAIFPVYKLFRMARYEDNGIRFTMIIVFALLILIPFTTTLAFVLLFKKTLGEMPANDCPICGSTLTGKAEEKFKATGFQAFHNRCCYLCDAVWKPGCPKWLALVGIAAGALVWFLDILLTKAGALSDPIARYLLAGLAAAPALYGLTVLLGNGDRIEILSKGQNAVKQPARKK